MSPGCRYANSAPAPQAKYRESNASRLRQEMKGMTITGVVKKGPRSQSSSPLQRTANSSPTRGLHSEILVPRRRDSDKTIDLNSTPRTMSETSSNSRDTDRCRITASAPLGYVIVDTRSKTLNTVHPTPSQENVCKKGVMAPNLVGVRPNIASGYGKPLVTPINKRLAIRRDYAIQDSAPLHGKSPIICRARSPTKSSWKAEKRGTFPSSAKASEMVAEPRLLIPKVDVVTSILIHIIVWRFAHIASCLFFKAWYSTVAIIALAVLFWTATKETSTNPLRASNTSPNVRRERTPVGGSAGAKPKRPLSSSIYRPKSPTKLIKSLDKQPVSFSNKPKQLPVTKCMNPKTDLKGEKVPLDSPSPPKPSKIPTLRNPSTEKLKQQFCRDTPVYAAGRPNSNMHSSTRSFKPQLEDIKSSYLLLSKKPIETPKPAAVEIEKMSEPLTKPRVIDENQRKELLVEVKRKFQSREFKAHARYDKIEGLNWISWK